jgi:hypothetical protein
MGRFIIKKSAKDKYFVVNNVEAMTVPWCDIPTSNVEFRPDRLLLIQIDADELGRRRFINMGSPKHYQEATFPVEIGITCRVKERWDRFIRDLSKNIITTGVVADILLTFGITEQ